MGDSNTTVSPCLGRGHYNSHSLWLKQREGKRLYRTIKSKREALKSILKITGLWANTSAKILPSKRKALMETVGLKKFEKILYSQEGKNLLLWRMISRLHGSAPGRYVDIGCNHPWKFSNTAFSNTAFIYERGWRGMAIDPNPDFKNLFRTERPEDFFLNCCVGPQSEISSYFTFEKVNSDEIVTTDRSDRFGIKEVPIRIINNILSEYNSTNPKIDMLSVDCEGMHLEILCQFDFMANRPSYIIVERDKIYPPFNENDEIHDLLKN